MIGTLLSFHGTDEDDDEGSIYKAVLLLYDLLAVVLQVVNEPPDVHCPIVEMSTRAKLSCLSWDKQSKNIIASSDYDGIVTVWDVNRGQVNHNHMVS